MQDITGRRSALALSLGAAASSLALAITPAAAEAPGLPAARGPRQNLCAGPRLLDRGLALGTDR